MKGRKTSLHITRGGQIPRKIWIVINEKNFFLHFDFNQLRAGKWSYYPWHMKCKLWFCLVLYQPTICLSQKILVLASAYALFLLNCHNSREEIPPCPTLLSGNSEEWGTSRCQKSDIAIPQSPQGGPLTSWQISASETALLRDVKGVDILQLLPDDNLTLVWLR